MEFVFTPWKGRLIDDLRRAQREIILVCPYITKVIADEIHEAVANRGIDVKTVSRFEKAEFLMGSSDLDAHYVLSGVGASKDAVGVFELRGLPKVHAKIFIIDGHIAYVGSSNLTFSGLLRNYESTVRIVGPENVEPLRSEVLAMWPRLKQIRREHFVDMLGKLQGGSFQKAGRFAAEHFYDIHTPLDGEGVAAEGDQIRRAIEEASAPSRASPVIDRAPVPSTDELILDSLGITSSVETAGVDAAASRRAPVDVVREHGNIVRRFLDLLRDRFGVDVGRGATTYARVLRTKACGGLWTADLDGLGDFGLADPKALYAEEDAALHKVGVLTYELCVALVATKSGILSTYGPGIASDFRQRAVGDAVLLAGWRHNFLGPQLYAVEAERSNAQLNLRVTREATFKLFAALSMLEGMQRTLEIYEEFFNPLDLLGTDAVSLVAFEAPKTTLQNLSQKHGWKLPVYAPATSEGAMESLIWHGRAEMLGLSGVATARRQRDAENLAAAALLQKIEASTQWAGAVEEYRETQLDRAFAHHQPLFPKVDLPRSVMDALEDRIQSVFGLRVKPSLGFVALVDNETRRAIRLHCSNTAMSWFGSFVLNCVLSQVQAERYSLDAPELRTTLFRLFEVKALREAVGIRVELDDPAHGATIVNAICCALYFSNPFEFLAAALKPILQKAIDLSPRPTVFDPHDRVALAKLVATFDANVIYGRLVQDVTQARDRTPPTYVVTDVLTVPHGREDAVGVACSWKTYQGRARGKNKVVARNMAAFALLSKLALDDSLWAPAAPAEQS